MNIVQNNDKPLPAFELKGSALTLMVLHLLDPDRTRLAAQLQAQFGQSPGFFRNAPLLIDCTALSASGTTPDLAELTGQLRTLGLVPVALRGGGTTLQTAALAAGLGLLPSPRSEQTEQVIPSPLPPVSVVADVVAAAEEEVGEADPAPLPAPAIAAKIITRTIRSGQRVVAATGDLIIFGTVNAGAEILASGNIHIYGSLRGRALAGIHGDTTARICALQFQPELVAIAGDYLMQEEIDPALLGNAVVVSHGEEKLSAEKFGAFVPSGDPAGAR